MAKKPGPKPWEPTPEERNQVKAYAAVGLTLEQMGLLMGKSHDSIQRHCRDELDKGLLEANARIGAKLYQKAAQGHPASMFFWLKTRAGWRERNELALTDTAGNSLTPAKVAIEFVEGTAPLSAAVRTGDE